jgi:hypothetical protein
MVSYSSSPIYRRSASEALQRDAQWMWTKSRRGRTYLWRKVEPQETAASQTILYQERYFVRETYLNGFGQSLGLAEVDEVFEGESERDGLGELDVDVLLGVLDILVASQGNGAIANVAVA